MEESSVLCIPCCCPPFNRQQRQQLGRTKKNVSLLFIALCLAAASSVTCFPFAFRSYKNSGQEHSIRAKRSSPVGDWFRNLQVHPRNDRSISSSLTRRPSSSSLTRLFLIPPEQLDQLRDSVDLVSVVESYNLPKFQHRGDKRAVALCPFHDDNNPSLSIDGTRGIYKCFSCGAGGNVYNFIQEYGKLEGEEISFMQAVTLVNDKYAQGFSLDLGGSGGNNRLTPEERQALAKKKDRLFLANAIAAGFYTTAITSVSAGTARSHLGSRGLNAATVKAFAIGYAPDVYFSGGNRSKAVVWGEGSLVHHLRDNGFTPTEIIDAGLATRTKRSSATLKDPSMDGNSMFATSITTNSTNGTVVKEEDMDFSSLMDRFRGRLVVPIFDAMGKHVLGFGGRILQQGTQQQSSDFKAPKYLNSPESPVFSKKTLLFGHHMAKDAVQESKSQGDERASSVGASVVIVEGYMDAIAMWQAGVRETVACMGTALTSEQLGAAAKTAGARGGRVILCLDNDDAGIAAVERVCSGSIISSVAEQYIVEIRIASLPENVKDPAEFLESYNKQKGKKEGSSAAGEFRKEVLDTSVEWTEWYIDRILRQYDSTALRGAAGSFGDTFERVAEFLATFKNAADRTKRACEVAASLADIMAEESDSTSMSNTVRIQLESDLVDKASRIANSRDAVARRIESVEGGSDADVQAKLSNVARGSGLSGDDDKEKFSWKKLKEDPENQPKIIPGPLPSKKKTVSMRPKDQLNGPEEQQYQRRTYKPRNAKKEAPILTPHFAGFEFANDSDAEWLGLSKDKGKRKKENMYVGKSTRNEGNRFFQRDPLNNFGQEEPVFFNSNEYHGHQFITKEALDAGYSNIAVEKDPSILEKGIGSLVQYDAGIMSSSAEDTLLRTMVLFQSARRAMKNSMDVSRASGSGGDIQWSNPEKAWLFTCLADKIDETPSEYTGPEHLLDLRLFLASREDTPKGAFGEYKQEQKQSISDDSDILERDQEIPGDESDQTVDTTSIPILQDEIQDIPHSDGFDIPDDIYELDDWAASFDPSILEMEEESPSKSKPPMGNTAPKVAVAATIPANDGSPSPGGSVSTSALDSSQVQKMNIGDSTNGGAVIDTEAVVLDDVNTTLEGDIIIEIPGFLDRYFFSPEEDVFTSTSEESMRPEARAELAVQELYATLLWTSAVHRLSLLKKKLAMAAGMLLEESKDEEGNADQLLQVLDASKMGAGILPFDGPVVDRQELTEYCTSLTEELREAASTVQILADSVKRVSKRLVDAAATSGISEGRISHAQYNELNEKLEDHMDEIHKWSHPDPEILEDEPYEDTLERVQSEWGILYDDHYMYNPEDATETAPYEIDTLAAKAGIEGMDYLFDTADAEEDEESLEDALDRMDLEWGIWLEDDVPAPK